MAKSATYKVEQGVKYRGWDKTSRIPARIIEDKPDLGRKPEWLKIKLPNTTEIGRVNRYYVKVICIVYVKKLVVQI